MRTPLAILIVVGTLAASSAARGDDDCAVPMADWQPRAAVQQMATAQGWTVRRIRIDDGCYQIDALNGAGRAIEIKVDPGTLAVKSIEFQD